MKLTIAIIAITAAFATTASAGNFSARDINEGTSVNVSGGRLAGQSNFKVRSPRLSGEENGEVNLYSFSTKSVLGRSANEVGGLR